MPWGAAGRRVRGGTVAPVDRPRRAPDGLARTAAAPRRRRWHHRRPAVALAVGLGLTVAVSCGTDPPVATTSADTRPSGTTSGTEVSGPPATSMPTGTTPESAPPDASPGSTSAPTTSPRTAPPTTARRDPTLGSGATVTIAFGGDVHFEKMIRSRLDADPATVMAPVSGLLGGADLAVVNLETAVTTRGTPAPKDFTFRTPDTAFDALRAAGVDAVTMANNHGLDFGTVGLDDSLASAEAKGFPVVGIGKDEDQAFAPWITEVKGQRIALIGATQVLDSNLITAWTATDTQGGLASAKRVDRLTESVREARAEADTVIVFLHWGTEKQTCPNERQREIAPLLVDAGADIVVGSHAHRVLGGGMMGDAVVNYGLGNFVFYTPGGPGTESGVFTVTATGRRIDGYDWAPAQIQGGIPTPLEGGAAASAEASWEALRDCTGLTP